MAGAVRAGASRQVCAAMVAAAIRTFASLPDGGDADINKRVHDLKKGLTLHKALDEVNGYHAHNLGTAVAAVRPKLDGPSQAAARATQRRANRARHRRQPGQSRWSPGHKTRRANAASAVPGQWRPTPRHPRHARRRPRAAETPKRVKREVKLEV